MSSLPEKPDGLGTAGAAFWAEVTQRFESWRPDEAQVLVACCKTLDRIAKLDAALADAPLTVAGSAGQLREHPLLSEQRQQYVLLSRLLRQLDLPESAERTALRDSASVGARALARQRWSG